MDDGIENELASFDDRPRVVRWFADGSTFVLTRFVVLRLLGGVYFVAFLSALLQSRALIGEHGLLPMGGYLNFVARISGGRLAGFARVPSLFWIDATDSSLFALVLAGTILGAAVMLGVTNAGVMLVLWALQFSLAEVGQIFWSYGWEMQLLETGMLAAVLCPMVGWRPASNSPPVSVVWLLRWLIIRVMLGAGLIKLRGDVCWRDLTCLLTHYETQPNPSPLSWLFHHFPPAAQTVSVLFNHLVELVAPFFVLGPRWARRLAGALFVVFQAILITSGNLAFLNWLTIVPALACFDDDLLLRFVPPRWRDDARAVVDRALESKPSRWHRRVAIGYAVVVGALSFGPVMNLLSSHQAMNASFDPLHLVNTYGAFGTVNRVRDEVILEGTHDAEVGPETRWEEYELPCKPGPPARRPCLVSPYHYRLDWQMWFAAMSSVDDEPWLAELVDKLLRGERAVVPLFAQDPFASGPPRFVRARLFRYELASFEERRAGVWWRRRPLTSSDRQGGSSFLRPVGLGDPDLELFLDAHRLR
jgi:hypothetical protein